MKGDTEIVSMLNNLLHEELVGSLHYFMCAEVWEYWGYHDKYKKFKRMAMKKGNDADKIIERILCLEGIPVYGGTPKIAAIMDIESQFKNVLALEQKHLESYKKLIGMTMEKADTGTRLFIEGLYPCVERNIKWLEQQLFHIAGKGVKGYIA